jgi:antitoxin component of MazEF toxin-antitoxin module
MTMKGVRVGQTCSDLTKWGNKDAFHVPGVMVRSLADVEPGQNLYLSDDGNAMSTSKEQRHGIADPWVEETIPAGTLFWLFLNPDMTENLSHHFDVKGISLAMFEHNDLLGDEAVEDIGDVFYDDVSGCSC